jgi:hypothetical protein
LNIKDLVWCQFLSFSDNYKGWAALLSISSLFSSVLISLAYFFKQDLIDLTNANYDTELAG